MSTPVRLAENYGILTFEFAATPEAAEGVQVKADLYAVNAAYLQSYKDAPDDPYPLFVSRLAGQGFPTLSHMNAERVVKAVQDEIARLEKPKPLRECRLSQRYGFPVFDLPGPDKLALDLNLPILDAEERLRTGCADDEVYDLTLIATGDEEAAAAALTERAAWRLSRNQTPDV